MGLIVQTSREAGIDTTFPQSLNDCYARDVARGHGIHDLPALYEAFLPEEQSEIAHEPEANDRHGAFLCRHANAHRRALPWRPPRRGWQRLVDGMSLTIGRWASMSARAVRGDRRCRTGSPSTASLCSSVRGDGSLGLVGGLPSRGSSGRDFRRALWENYRTLPADA